MSVVEHAVENWRENMDEQSSSSLRRLTFQVRGSGCWQWGIVTAAILLAGCQSERRASPPPPPPPPPLAAPVQPLVPLQKAITPAQWKAEADHWQGVKYRKGGIDRSGVDCWGLTAIMYLDVAGIALPRTGEEQFRSGKEVLRNDLRPGDLVFFISLSERVIDHVGLYLGNTEFIHASPSKGVVVSSLRQDYYEKRFQGAKRIIP